MDDVNDNVPMTPQPVYYPSIVEGSAFRTLIIKLNATDDDIDKSTKVTYKIISGNPEGFFEINKATGKQTASTIKIKELQFLLRTFFNILLAY